MTRIDPIRRSALLRRAVRPDPADETGDAPEAEIVRLPVPVERTARVEPKPPRDSGGAAFAAQLIGQDGMKRGLRAGPEVIDSAKQLYNRTEWSGAKDRRAPKGAKTRTEA
jgi:hypothetical protein